MGVVLPAAAAMSVEVLVLLSLLLLDLSSLNHLWRQPLHSRMVCGSNTTAAAATTAGQC
jgi:hypothetical protein